MKLSKSKTGKLKFLAVYGTGDNILLSDDDIHNKNFQIDIIKIIDLKTRHEFTPSEFFKKEESGITI